MEAQQFVKLKDYWREKELESCDVFRCMQIMGCALSLIDMNDNG